MMKEAVLEKRMPPIYAAAGKYALIHFGTEVACYYFLFNRMQGDDRWWMAALAYDAIAFLPQSLFGALTDRFPKLPIGEAGIALVFAALLLPWHTAALTVLAIGNAMVHVCGAQGCLRGAQGKMAPCGIYVGGGSFGVIAGQLLGSMHCKVLLPLVGLIVSFLLMLLIPDVRRGLAADGFDCVADRPIGQLTALTFLAVAVRAYMA